MDKYQLSVIVPGIRQENWIKFYNSLEEAIGKYTWEVIFIGPFLPPESILEKKNIKYILEYGSPSRAFQIGSLLSEGKYICFGTDDAIAQKDSLAECLDILEKENDTRIIITSYVEGINIYGPSHAKHFSEPSWHAGYHASLRLKNVNPEWFIGMPIMRRKHFLNLGGIDCRYEHINLNIYLMLFKAQITGAKISVSPNFVYLVDFDPKRDPKADPILQAGNVDQDLFRSDVASPIKEDPIQIDNWRLAESRWKRRW